jgi:hypothetical protein
MSFSTDGNKLPKMDNLVQLVGIVLLFLAGLIGSTNKYGKKYAD